MEQKTKQRLIYKINTDRLKRAKWNMSLDIETARKLDEVVALSDSQTFRFIEAITGDTSQFKKDIVAIVSNNKTEFRRACKGFTLNGIKFKRFEGTTGGVKKNTVLFVSERVYDELDKRANNGRDVSKKLVPAKFEAYKSLMCSSSIPVTMPKGILVVKDCITHFKDKVIHVDDTKGDRPEVRLIEDFDVEVNATDGFGLCTVEYIEQVSRDLGLDYTLGGFNSRFAFTKGMVYPFDLVEFAKEVAGTYTVEDVWGKKHDIRNIQLVLTESMLKLWDSYTGIRHFLRCCEENGYEFSVAKTVPKQLEDVRDLNYQYLQSYKLSDEDIKELAQPTIDWIKASICGDHSATLKFLGVDENSPKNGNTDFIQALMESEKMMKDPFVVSKVYRNIKKKIDNAKIGKLRCNANYQIASGDPYLLIQSMFGLQPTGILKRGEFYSSYWVDKGVHEILLFRSPMTSHNNIVKANIIDSDMTKKWYKHMKNVIIFNAWDTSMSALNGQDFDSDSNFTTNNKILLKNHIPMPSIVCVQRSADKHIITEELLQKANEDGFGNDVGTITNRVTTQFEVMARFDEDTDEYKELEYRIICGQLYQQNSIDKIKGIETTPMDKIWYDYKSCNDEFEKSIVAEKKPKFMIYIYPETMAKYKKYIESINKKCMRVFGIDMDALFEKSDKTEEELEFIRFYHRGMPVGLGNCVCNKICEIIEEEFKDFPPYAELEFDESILKSNRKYTIEQFESVRRVYDEYKDRSIRFEIGSKYKRVSKEDSIRQRELFKQEFKEKALMACKDKNVLCNIVVDMCYKSNNSKQFVWDVSYDELVENIRRNCK